MIALTKLVLGFVLININPKISKNYQPINKPLAIHYKAENDNINKKSAFKILQTKCNVCHKKRNPFLIFKLKNMDKRAKRIYKQVFVKKRMPKGDEIKLTQKEYDVLETWLKTNL